MDCLRCESVHYCKDGFVKERQRYKCKHCSYHYTVVKKSDVKSPEIRQLAIDMYLEGLGFRSIG
jgi:transposase-like protein